MDLTACSGGPTWSRRNATMSSQEAVSCEAARPCAIDTRIWHSTQARMQSRAAIVARSWSTSSSIRESASASDDGR